MARRQTEKRDIVVIPVTFSKKCSYAMHASIISIKIMTMLSFAFVTFCFWKQDDWGEPPERFYIQ